MQGLGMKSDFSKLIPRVGVGRDDVQNSPIMTDGHLTTSVKQTVRLENAIGAEFHSVISIEKLL
jgi:hypothetical protein